MAPYAVDAPWRGKEALIAAALAAAEAGLCVQDALDDLYDLGMAPPDGTDNLEAWIRHQLATAPLAPATECALVSLLGALGRWRRAYGAVVDARE